MPAAVVDGTSCLADELAVAFTERAVRRIAWRGRHQLEVIPRPLALGRLLHFEQIRMGEIAAILADRGLAKAIILETGIFFIRATVSTPLFFASCCTHVGD